MIGDQMAGARYALNPQVLHESIDGEVIIIDLTTGSYYSLRGSAAEVWQLLGRSSGATTAELADALARQYQSDVDIEPAVSRFLGQLSEESLVSGVEESDESGAALSLPERNGPPSRSFEPPVLEKYTDMQDLVLLDPVHEVDQQGWPRLPEAASSGSTA